MSWFEASNWANIAKTAKTAVKYAQKNIDKVLEIPEIITEKDHVTEENASDARAANGTVVAETEPDIKEETDGFFSLFGVADPSSNGISSKPKESSLLPPTSRLKSSPSISRVSSTASLTGLRAVESWIASDTHSELPSSSNFQGATSSTKKEENSLLPAVHSLPSVNAASSSLAPSSSFQSLHSASQERLLAFSKSNDKLETLEDDDTSAAEFLPLQIPSGRLEIIFHDEDAPPSTKSPENLDELVEVSLVPAEEEVKTTESVSSIDQSTEGTLQKSVFDLIDQSTEGAHDEVDGDSISQSTDTFVHDVATSNSLTAVVHLTAASEEVDRGFSDVRIVRLRSVDTAEDEEKHEDSELISFESADPIADLSSSSPTLELEPVKLETIDILKKPVTEPLMDSGPFQAELDRLRSVLASREQKLLDVSRENAQLKETNDNLSSQISDWASSRTEMEQRDKDFALMERKLQQLTEEKASLAEQLLLTKTELSTYTNAKKDNTAAQLKEALKKVDEKEQTIKELMQEGEKLSKQQFQSSSHIQKQKAKQKELETENAKLKSDLEDRVAEVTTLKSTLTLAEELDQKNNATMKQQNASVERLERDLVISRNLLDESKAKISSMQAALDSAYKELADLHRQKATQEGHVHEALLTTELAAKEELRQALEQQKQDLILGQEELTERVEALQTSLNRTEATLRRKEDAQREEIADYQQRLQDSMTRNEELSQNLTQATRPLLRQNEALQRQIAEQSVTFDQVERSLTKRLQDASTQLALAQGKERDATDKLAVLTGSIEALDSQLTQIRLERASLSSDVDAERRKARMLEEKLTATRNDLEKLRETSTAELSALRREKQLLDHQIALERENLSMEQRKTANLAEQVGDLQRLSRTSSAQADSGVPLRRSDSVNSNSSTLDGRWSPTSQQTNSLYDVLRGGTAPFLESVQSQLRLKEGEVLHLRTELRQLEASRLKYTDEIIKLNEKTQEIEKLRGEIEAAQADKEELGRRYQAMLQMYGEKAEELQELRLDYEDMKALYRTQIDALTQKS
ncbi:TATA element modulatory factor [Hypsibius exemplaris]|uniref:TATA element modulatory factor n=1 Tax=Hypsibius exemplaris TaxID=2072580 RepID=A0A1W0X3Z0_HYPEX|nr:TATA element modulatory factor [Hypsibius exemplaris]